jgi:hypothetical protein
VRSIKWRDASGKLQVIDQYCDADLPPHIAERALPAYRVEPLVLRGLEAMREKSLVTQT